MGSGRRTGEAFRKVAGADASTDRRDRGGPLGQPEAMRAAAPLSGRDIGWADEADHRGWALFGTPLVRSWATHIGAEAEWLADESRLRNQVGVSIQPRVRISSWRGETHFRIMAAAQPFHAAWRRCSPPYPSSVVLDCSPSPSVACCRSQAPPPCHRPSSRLSRGAASSLTRMATFGSSTAVTSDIPRRSRAASPTSPPGVGLVRVLGAAAAAS